MHPQQIFHFILPKKIFLNLILGSGRSMCEKPANSWRLQGLFLHNQSLIIVEGDNIYRIQKNHYILNEQATLTKNPLCHWSEYQYSATSFKDKLKFILLHVHSLMGGFVFQDDELFVHYIKNEEYRKAFKAFYQTTFFSDELQGNGLSFIKYEDRIRSFHHNQSEFYCWIKFEWVLWIN